MNKKIIITGIALIIVILCVFAGVKMINKEGKTPENTLSETTETTTQEETTEKKKPDILILVNAQNPIPSDYSINLVDAGNGKLADDRILPELNRMFADAHAAGFEFFVRSGYRSYTDQKAVFQEYVDDFMAQGYSEDEAVALTKNWVATPGYSEHHTGLGVDINPADDENKENGYVWLAEHCTEYGFVLRYPADKVEITGISNERWHFRYVGKEVAKYMTEHNLVLEEYTAMLGSGEIQTSVYG